MRRQILNPSERRVVNAVIVFLAIAAFLYLFVYPALVATGIIELDATTFAIGVFLTMLFWLVIANGAYAAAADIYQLRRKNLLPDTLVQPSLRLVARIGHRKAERPHAPVTIGLLSYFLVIYEYAITYTLLSRLDAQAFNIGRLSLFDAIYFSLTTAATVGFGDIVPSSTLARVFVMAEILLTFSYVVFIFSVLGSSVRAANVSKDKEIETEQARKDADAESRPPRN
jgi:hypothetical protein